jgi:hypothetical protein
MEKNIATTPIVIPTIAPTDRDEDDEEEDEAGVLLGGSDDVEDADML